MSDFMDEAIIAFEEFKQKDCCLENSISSIELRYKGEELQEIIWEFSILLRSNGFTKEAVICVEHLIAYTDNPEQLAQLYMALGQIMEMMKDFEASILYYLHAKSLNPEGEDTAYFVNNNLGYCLNFLNRYGEAEGYCRTAIDINPERHNAYKNLGIALQGKGCFAEAARNFIKASAAYPADPRASDLLGRLVSEHGEVLDEIPDIRQQLKRARIRWALA